MKYINFYDRFNNPVLVVFVTAGYSFGQLCTLGGGGGVSQPFI